MTRETIQRMHKILKSVPEDSKNNKILKSMYLGRLSDTTGRTLIPEDRSSIVNEFLTYIKQAKLKSTSDIIHFFGEAFLIYTVLKGYQTIPRHIISSGAFLNLLGFQPTLAENTENYNLFETTITFGLWESFRDRITQAELLAGVFDGDGFILTVSELGELFLAAFEYKYPDDAKLIMQELVAIKLKHHGD